MANSQRFLVKMVPTTGTASLSIAGMAVTIRAQLLFKSIGAQHGMGAAAVAAWHIVETPLALDATNPWDVCHQMVTQGLSFVGGSRVEFAEPDIPQQWVSKSPSDQAFSLTSSDLPPI